MATTNMKDLRLRAGLTQELLGVAVHITGKTIHNADIRRVGGPGGDALGKRSLSKFAAKGKSR
jgi:hypothetical protein